MNPHARAASTGPLEHDMPRHNPENTPPDKRRASYGSVLRDDKGRVVEGRFPHTAESMAHLEAAKARLGLSDAELYRRALALLAAQP